MNRIDYYRSILLGFIVGVVFITGFYVFTSDDEPQSVTKPVAQQVDKHGTFTVVSEYKGCDLVQWQYNMLAEYKYFLHCK
jgi:hypothetical protein